MKKTQTLLASLFAAALMVLIAFLLSRLMRSPASMPSGPGSEATSHLLSFPRLSPQSPRADIVLALRLADFQYDRAHVRLQRGSINQEVWIMQARAGLRIETGEEPQRAVLVSDGRFVYQGSTDGRGTTTRNNADLTTIPLRAADPQTLLEVRSGGGASHWLAQIGGGDAAFLAPVGLADRLTTAATVTARDVAVIAGREALSVEVEAADGLSLYWVDVETGVLLKQQTPAGDDLEVTFIEFDPVFISPATLFFVDRSLTSGTPSPPLGGADTAPAAPALPPFPQLTPAITPDEARLALHLADFQFNAVHLRVEQVTAGATNRAISEVWVIQDGALFRRETWLGDERLGEQLRLGDGTSLYDSTQDPSITPYQPQSERIAPLHPNPTMLLEGRLQGQSGSLWLEEAIGGVGTFLAPTTLARGDLIIRAGEPVAGRATIRVQVQAEGVSAELWVDVERGVILRQDIGDRRTEVTFIEFDVPFDRALFTLPEDG